MNDETTDLFHGLLSLRDIVRKSGSDVRRRIAGAFREAQTLSAEIDEDGDDARPRIMACIIQSDACHLAGDVAFIGWMLQAMKERVNEQNLTDWTKLRDVVDDTVNMLPVSEPTVH